MSGDLEIIANNGKIYKNIRAYHIALGHAVRQALINFANEIEEFLQGKIQEFYSEYNPQDYNRSYQLLNKMKLGELIKTSIKGNFEGNYEMEYNLFDWEVLDSIDNGIGEYGSYMDFDKSDSREDVESYLQSGIYGHEPLDLYTEIDNYVKNYLDDRVQKVLDEF